MYNIDFTTIKFNENYKIKYGSILQIFKGLENMENYICSENEIDDYKKNLYPKIRQYKNLLLSKFLDILKSDNEVAQDIKKHCLFIYNKKIRNNNSQLSYKYCNFGIYLKIIIKKFDFIISKEIPHKFSDDDLFKKEFKKFQTQILELRNIADDILNNKWPIDVEYSRNNSGEDVKNNTNKKLKKLSQ